MTLSLRSFITIFVKIVLVEISQMIQVVSSNDLLDGFNNVFLLILVYFTWINFRMH